jgi:histidyl-tRNA synthetase
VRAYVQNGVGAREPVTKWYYLGPMFRRERPQKGRYRQFHQAGAEVFGAGAPVVDAELVTLLADFFDAVGLSRSTVLFNHLGNERARGRFREALVGYYAARRDELCPDCVRRLETNPLRLLDCKVDGCVALREDAPVTTGSLEDPELEELDLYRELLEAAGVEHRQDPRMVRGLDYYTGLVFEVEVETGDGPVVVVGGGRYDALVERLGGAPTPAAGFAVGLERLASCLPETPAEGLDVFVLVPDAAARVRAAGLMREARGRGLSADLDPRGGSVKSQMKRAHKLGASFVVILGERELAEGRVSLKDMHSGEQRQVPAGAVVDEVAERTAR